MPLKIGSKLTHIGPKFWICITFDLLMRFWWDRSMLEVWYWSPWPRTGTPSMCTQTAQTRKFKKFSKQNFFFQNFRKIKRAQMCHMVACMRSSVWDVKGTLLENLLMQKNFWNFENFFSSQICEEKFGFFPKIPIFQAFTQSRLGHV